MAFLLLIEDGGVVRKWPAAQQQEAHARMNRFTEALKTRGIFKASDALRPDSEGARVQVRDGQRIVVDGPFAESKEVAGGFYLIECGSKAEAIAIAAECPAAEWGTIEVREIRS